MRDGGEQAKAPLRLNCGSGNYPLPYWTNLDVNRAKPADIHAEALTYLRSQPVESYEDIYAGHLIEHMRPEDALALVRECYRVLLPGGRLGLLVPDTREIMRRYLAGDETKVQFPVGQWWPVADLDAVCALFLYSTLQDSPHLWSYDEITLARLLRQAGFEGLRPIDRYSDPRIPVGAFYQVGWDGWKR